MTNEQIEAIARAGLRPDDWEVIRDRKYSMVIRNRLTNEVKTVMGWTDTRTIKKYFGKYITCEKISKTALARYMCG